MTIRLEVRDASDVQRDYFPIACEQKVILTTNVMRPHQEVSRRLGEIPENNISVDSVSFSERLMENL